MPQSFLENFKTLSKRFINRNLIKTSQTPARIWVQPQNQALLNNFPSRNIEKLKCKKLSLHMAPDAKRKLKFQASPSGQFYSRALPSFRQTFKHKNVSKLLTSNNDDDKYSRSTFVWKFSLLPARRDAFPCHGAKHRKEQKLKVFTLSSLGKWGKTSSNKSKLVCWIFFTA